MMTSASSDMRDDVSTVLEDVQGQRTFGDQPVSLGRQVQSVAQIPIQLPAILLLCRRRNLRPHVHARNLCIPCDLLDCLSERLRVLAVAVGHAGRVPRGKLGIADVGIDGRRGDENNLSRGRTVRRGRRAKEVHDRVQVLLEILERDLRLSEYEQGVWQIFEARGQTA